MSMEPLEAIRLINSPLSPLLTVNFFGADANTGSLAGAASIFQQLTVGQIGLDASTFTDVKRGRS